jgi:integrase
MFLSKTSSGIYYLFFNDANGKRCKVSTQSRLKKDATKFLQSFKLSEYKLKQKAQNRPLDEFTVEYLAYAKGVLAPGSVYLHELALKQLRKSVGNLPVKDISPQHIDKLKSELIQKVNANLDPIMNPVTVNERLSKLKSVFNTALRWNLIAANPVKGIQPVSVPERAPSFFSREDFQKLISFIKEVWLKEVVIFAVLTGMRRGEITNLRWQDIDLNRKLLTIQSSPTFKTKNGRRRIIPLNDTAFYVLSARHGKETSEYVFTNNGRKVSEGWLTHAFKKAVYDVRLTDDRLHFHSLRHTFASWLVQDGVSIYAVKELLGHSDVKTTQAYSHLVGSELHSEVNKISIVLN